MLHDGCGLRNHHTRDSYFFGFFAGVVATKYQRPDGTLQDVRLQLSPGAREAEQAVEQLPLPTLAGGTVPLRQVATVTTVAGPTEIQRRDRERVIGVASRVKDLQRDLAAFGVHRLGDDAVTRHLASLVRRGVAATLADHLAHD